MPDSEGKTKSARIKDQELLELLESEGEKTQGGSSEVIRRALRNYLYTDSKLVNQDEMSVEEYDALIEKTGDYFTELFMGYEGPAMEIGEEIREIDENTSDYLAKVTVYLEEEGLVQHPI